MTIYVYVFIYIKLSSCAKAQDLRTRKHLGRYRSPKEREILGGVERLGLTVGAHEELPCLTDKKAS